MSLYEIDTGTARSSAASLRVSLHSLATISDDLDQARSIADLHDEIATARTLVTEITEEVDLLQQLLDARAAAMELADAGFSARVTGSTPAVASLSALLRHSLHDDVGSTGSAAELRDHYTRMALERAGIDPAAWIPERGLDHNQDIVERVYGYYADLYRQHPDQLWWAGMAAMIGPSFYAGFQDLDTFSIAFGIMSDVASKLKYVGMPHSPLTGQLAELGADELADELRWYQQRLLAMQQEIFLDMAPAHEAYMDGGLLAIERLYESDSYGFGQATVGAWQQIEHGRRIGDPDLIAKGNATLLLREQRQVIDDDYEEMYSRPAVGAAITYAMTALGQPSIPGTESYAEHSPLVVDASQYVGTPREVTLIPHLWHQSLPHVGGEGTIEITTPLPDGNIAHFEDRWRLIEADTLPVWTDLAQHHQGEVLDILDTPVAERASSLTIDPGQLADWANTGWEADFSWDWRADW